MKFDVDFQFYINMFDIGFNLMLIDFYFEVQKIGNLTTIHKLMLQFIIVVMKDK